MLIVAANPLTAHGQALAPQPDEPTATALFDPNLVLEAARSEMFPEGRDRTLEISGHFQFRALLNSRSQPSKEDIASGFVLRRAKLKAKGMLMGDDLRYTFSMSFNRKTGVGSVEDFNIDARLADGLRLRVGQFRPGLLREESVSSKRQLAVERSLIAKAFTQPRVRGIALKHETARTRVSLALMDASPVLGGDQSWEIVTRGEVLILGRFKRFKDFTSFPDDEPAVMLGASVGVLDLDARLPDSSDTTIVRWTVDLSAEAGGSNVFVAFVGNRVDQDMGPTLDQYGLVVQGGAFITDTTELFARYELGDADNSTPTLSILTIGANEYLDGHALKFTVDAGFALDEVAGFWSSSGRGWLTDASGHDGQVLLRTQLQLMF